MQKTTLKKSEVDAYVMSGDIYERLGAVIGTLQIRDNKFMKREAFEKNKDGNYVLQSWLLAYVPSFKNFVHKDDGNKLVAGMTAEEKEAWDNWKKMSLAMPFPKEELRIIG